SAAGERRPAQYRPQQRPRLGPRGRYVRQGGERRDEARDPVGPPVRVVLALGVQVLQVHPGRTVSGAAVLDGEVRAVVADLRDAGSAQRLTYLAGQPVRAGSPPEPVEDPHRVPSDRSPTTTLPAFGSGHTSGRYREGLLETDAERVVYVVPVRRNRAVSGRTVQRDRVRLPGARLQPYHQSAPVGGERLQRGEQPAPHAAAPPGRP